jgi:outer membrane protein assembly factor BamB
VPAAAIVVSIRFALNESASTIDDDHGSAVYATPSVVNNVVYAGDTSGTFYALTSANVLLWQQPNASSSIKFGPITASALVTNGPNGTNGLVIFGDHAGFINASDRETALVRSSR